jgi:hemoglobin-like flavoprotein
MGVLSGLSPDQKTAIKDSWASLSKDAKGTGSAFFALLLKTHPEYKPQFRRFKDVATDDLEGNKALQVHSLLFMKGVGTLIEFIDEDEYADEVLHKIANRHMHLNVNEADLNKAAAVFVGMVGAAGPAWQQAFNIINPLIAKYTDEAKAGK